MPVAEPGAPEDLDGAERFELAGIEIYVDRRLSGVGGSWTIDAEGFGRWRRLVVLGVDLTSG